MATGTRPAKRAKLLSDVSSSGESDGEPAEAPTNGFKVNKEFARRFEHNKKREEKHRLEEKYQKSTSKAGRGKRAEENGDDEDDEDEEEEEEEDSEDDESEDDEGELATKDVDEEIFETLRAIKNKDPRVYDENAKFYSQFLPDTGEKKKDEAVPKEKPIYLHDYHRQNLLSGYTGEEDEEEEDLNDAEPMPRTYQEEQDAIRTQLIPSMHSAAAAAAANGTAQDSTGEDSDEETLLTTKSKPKHSHLPPPRPPQQPSAPTPRVITDKDVQTADQDPDTYLSNFLAARAWLPTATSKWQAFEDSDSSSDEARAEAFETAYNLRFEDPAASNEKLKSFARDVEGKYSVRRDAQTGRQRAREREREQREREKREREGERARLRKLRIEEVEEKVERIREAAGLKRKKNGKGKVEGRGDVGLDLEEWRDVLEGDFDEEEWEGVMRRRFGDRYYAEGENDEPESEEVDGGEKRRRKKKLKKKLKKPKWEDDIDIEDLVPGFAKEDKDVAFTLSSDDNDHDGGRGGRVPAEEEEDDDDDAEEEDSANDIDIENVPSSRTSKSQSKPQTKKDRQKAKAEAKKAARLQRRQIETLVDSSLPISHPHLIVPSSSSITTTTTTHNHNHNYNHPSPPSTSAPPPPPFRYRDTSPQSFGLTANDILSANDSQLNAYAGLKKMASWRDEEKKRRDRKRYSKKARLREWRRDVFGGDGEGGERGIGVVRFGVERAAGGSGGIVGGDGDMVDGERKKKKRKRTKKGKKVPAGSI